MKTAIVLIVVTFLLSTAFLQICATLYELADVIIRSSDLEPIHYILWSLFAVCTIAAVCLVARTMARRRRSKPLKPPQGSPITQTAPPWLYRAVRLAPCLWFNLLFIICLVSVIGMSVQPPGRSNTYLVLMISYWLVMWFGFRLVVAELTFRWMGYVWPMASSRYRRKGMHAPDDQKQEQWPPPSVHG